jgi:hypothetical protein
MRRSLLILLFGLTAAAGAGAVDAQAPATAGPPADAVERLRAVLPADVAERVLARVDAARRAGLPADALERRALKFAARGVPAANIERAVAEQAERLAEARSALERGSRRPVDVEVEAGAEALRQGVDGAGVSALARGAPSGRSLAVPLYVAGSLAARGLPSAEAIQRVQERLAAHASDADLEQLPAHVADRGNGGRPPAGAQGVGRSGRGGPPAGVPANGGAASRPPGYGGKPGTPPKGRP